MVLPYGEAEILQHLQTSFVHLLWAGVRELAREIETGRANLSGE